MAAWERLTQHGLPLLQFYFYCQQERTRYEQLEPLTKKYDSFSAILNFIMINGYNGLVKLYWNDLFKYSQLSTVQFWLCCSCFRAVLRILYLDPDPEICHTQNIINFFNILKKFTKIITYEEKISKGKQCLFVHQSFFSTFSCMDPDLYLFGIRRSSRKLIQLGSRGGIFQNKTLTWR